MIGCWVKKIYQILSTILERSLYNYKLYPNESSIYEVMVGDSRTFTVSYFYYSTVRASGENYRLINTIFMDDLLLIISWMCRTYLWGYKCNSIAVRVGQMLSSNLISSAQKVWFHLIHDLVEQFFKPMSISTMRTFFLLL